MKAKNPWITYIKNRIKNNKNFIVFIGGPTGSGKSYSSLDIADELSNGQFNIDQCVFKGLDLMNLVNSGKLKKGSVILFEEAGVDLSNRNWQSVQNKVLNYLFQTFRHKNFILIMNSPYMDFIDKATRKLFHAEFLTMRIDKTLKKCIIKPQLIQYNSRRDKFYYKYLRYNQEGSLRVIKEWGVSKPRPDLIKEYEKKKTEYTNQLNKEILEGLMEKEKKTKKKEWKCKACSYIWTPRTREPAYCPKCRKVGLCVPFEAVST